MSCIFAFLCEKWMYIATLFPSKTVSVSLSLCLYLCTRASGGLILIARQASKCLWGSVFPLSVTIPAGTMCFFAWQLITIGFATRFSKENWLSLSVKWGLLFLLTSCVCPLVQDVWLCGETDRHCYRECVSPVCRDGPRATSCSNRQLYQQSHAGTTATEMRKTENFLGKKNLSELLGIWGRH